MTINATYRNTATNDTFRATDTRKVGRWDCVFLTNLTTGEEVKVTKQVFAKCYEPFTAPAPDQVEAAVIPEEVDTTEVEIQDGKEMLAESLKGFAKFRANHRPEKVVVEGKTRRTQHNDDSLARELAALTLPQVYARAAEVLNTPVDELFARYKHLNPGMQRMNLGNRMRAVLRSDSTK